MNFLPLAPNLLAKVGRAVFITNAGPQADKNKLFRNMLIWGLSMSVVGAIVSWLAFTVLRLP